MGQAEVPQWWAMSAIYNRSMLAKKILDAATIECFIPMKSTVQCIGKRKVRQLVPAVRNLIFIYATVEQVKALKERYAFLQYLINRTDGKSHPIIVPDEQMRNFILVSSTNDDHLIYLNPEDINLRAGDRVRIVGGIFSGAEGIFVKVRGARDKRVVVAIDGIAAVATATIPFDLLKKL